MKYIFPVLFLCLCTSCATILNSKYQKVVITTDDPNDKILIDGEEPKMKKGKYLVQRDLTPKQITIQSKGQKDDHTVMMQYRKSPLLILSWIPFGVLYYVPYMDRGPKSWNYDKEIHIDKDNTNIQHKTETDKEVQINKVSVDLKAGDVEYRYFSSYRNFLNKEATKKAEAIEDKEMQVENTIFTSALNSILKDKGYIDTTKRILKSSYSNNIYLNATIQNYTLNYVKNSPGLTYGHGGMLFIDLDIDWEILDYYKTTLSKKSTTSRSGQFAVATDQEVPEAIESIIKDAMEMGLAEMINSEQFQKALSDKSNAKREKELEVITIPKATTYLSDLGQAIEASLTIKTDKGFGSGFLISSDGYLVTNYHVIANKEGLKIILNDGTEHDAQIIRVSKIHDLALLKIDVVDKIPFRISDSKTFKIAQEVYAVGTPTAEDLSQTISRGIISGIRKGDNGAKLIQTDASVNSGNSGGPIVTKEGLVIGVVSSKVKGFGIEGVAFGIPAHQILDQLKIVFK